MGVNLVEYDIEKDETKRAEMKKLTGGSTAVPLIEIEGVVIRGYAADEIRRTVEKKMKGTL